jgi:hypothetical protein
MKGLFLLLLGLAMAGCSNLELAQKPKQKVPANQPPVDSSTVFVIPNPYVDDLTLANKASDEAKQELVKRGYKLVASEAEAKLIAVPTVETNVTKVVATSTVRPIDLFSDGNITPLDRYSMVTNNLGSLGSLAFQRSSNSIGPAGDSLVIEAFPKDAWDKALIVNELQLQPAWKIRTPLPASLKPSIAGAQVARSGDTDFVLPH